MGFAFIVKVGEYEETARWSYVTFEYGRMLSTSSFPFRVFPSVTPKMHEFWKRVVLDDAFSWEASYVWPKSLKLVEVKHDVVDMTADLFIDPETYEHSRKLAALSKLTDEEARLLDIGHDYVFLKISQQRAQAAVAERLCAEMRDDCRDLTFELKR